MISSFPGLCSVLTNNWAKYLTEIPYNSCYILLMNNHIDSALLKLLTEYDSMEFLVLSNNHLADQMTQCAFEGIKSLKKIYMEWNLLRSIPTDLLITLEELRLDGNQVSVMSDAAFRRCPNLLILSLSNNSLGNKSSTIPPGVLLPYSILQPACLCSPAASPQTSRTLSPRQLHSMPTRWHVLGWDRVLSSNRITYKGLGKAA